MYEDTQSLFNETGQLSFIGDAFFERIVENICRLIYLVLLKILITNAVFDY